MASKFNPLMNKTSLLPPIQSRTLLASETGTPKKDSPHFSKNTEEAQNISTFIPPPPPPMPQNKLMGTTNSLSNLGQYWMKKTL